SVELIEMECRHMCEMVQEKFVNFSGSKICCQMGTDCLNKVLQVKECCEGKHFLCHRLDHVKLPLPAFEVAVLFSRAYHSECFLAMKQLIAWLKVDGITLIIRVRFHDFIRDIKMHTADCINKIDE